VPSFAFFFRGVDPSQGMLDVFRTQSNSNTNIDTVCQDAVAFSRSTEHAPYDRIFLKSVAHLLTHEQRMIAFEGFYKQLAPKRGKLLLICSLHSAEIYPFDQRTKGLFIKSRLDPAMLRGELEHVGFKHIEQETFTYEFPPESVKVDDWIYIVLNRVWTEFSQHNISEKQMAYLLDHIKKQFDSPTGFQTTSKQTIIKCCAD
jgi:hypothetical protein